MAKVEPRNVSPILQILRNFLLGREHNTHLRHQDYIAARTQPPPNLPKGAAHKLALNYYYTRDGRREVKPAMILADAMGRKAIAEGSSAGKEIAVKKPAAPGSVFKWD